MRARGPLEEESSDLVRHRALVQSSSVVDKNRWMWEDGSAQLDNTALHARVVEEPGSCTGQQGIRNSSDERISNSLEEKQSLEDTARVKGGQHQLDQVNVFGEEFEFILGEVTDSHQRAQSRPTTRSLPACNGVQRVEGEEDDCSRAWHLASKPPAEHACNDD